MKLDHSLRFRTSTGPTLEEFTLGYIHAACADLDEYSEFSSKCAQAEDLSYISVVMMRDESQKIFNIAKINLEKATNYNHINMSQFGNDLWLVSRGEESLYVSNLPKDIREKILKDFKEQSQPCKLIKKNENFIFEFQNPELNNSKIKEYLETYQSFSIKDDDIEKQNKIDLNLKVLYSLQTLDTSISTVGKKFK